MRRAFVVAAWLLAALLLPAGAVVAGPFEEATRAFEKGDYETAHRIIRPLAEKGSPEAQCNLGLMYFQGLGVPRDPAESAKWYGKAAEQGNAEAQMSLARMFALGAGVPQDPAEAAKWHRKAAEQDVPEAQLALGDAYAGGKGVPQDFSEAAKWYGKAADQGTARAQFQLGSLYYNGHGVRQDYVTAHMWLNVAASRFSPQEQEQMAKAIEMRDLAASRMTAAQIAEAQKLARKWKPKKPGKWRELLDRAVFWKTE